MTAALGGLVLACVSGVLIGSIGIGGVLLVTGLAFAGIVPVHEAVAVSMFTYLFSGVVGAWLYAREGSIDWGPALWLCLGATPAAFAGAVMATQVRSELLELGIAAVVLFAGLRAVAPRRIQAAAEERMLPPAALAAIGAVVGLLSAMTGTGGPLLLVPILVWFHLPILGVVGLSQAIQVPIAALATLGNVVYSPFDPALGALLTAGIIAGTAVGARIAHAAPADLLKRLVGLVLLLMGAALLLRSLQAIW